MLALPLSFIGVALALWTTKGSMNVMTMIGVIMTTVAMIFGMLPLALAIGSGAEARAPMARAVIGGLITSTLLTLFVVPVVYTVLDDVGRWVSSRLTSAADHDATNRMPEPAIGD